MAFGHWDAPPAGGASLTSTLGIGRDSGEIETVVLILGVFVLAALPVLGVVVLSRYGDAKGNRRSPLLLAVTFLMWAAALYVVFSFPPHGKGVALLIAGPAWVTYAMFFKQRS